MKPSSSTSSPEAVASASDGPLLCTIVRTAASVRSLAKSKRRPRLSRIGSGSVSELRRCSRGVSSGIDELHRAYPMLPVSDIGPQAARLAPPKLTAVDRATAMRASACM